LGGVDILVNGAGIGPEEPMLEVTDAVLDSLFDVNLKGAFITSSEAAKAMIRTHRKGVIIMVTSINARLPMPRAVGYSASKAGVEALTRGLAVELAPFQIRVCGVAPGYTDTPMLRKVYKDEFEYEAWRRDRVAKVPLGRFAQADEIAATVAFLASSEASYVTGTTLVVDGGRLAAQ
jgi:NAD(P)-dependent dehydrogenase (short-subunit alcohol dehydrogenase family)